MCAARRPPGSTAALEGCGRAILGLPAGRSGWATFLQIAFFGSLILTVASLFLSDYTPPFKACLTATVVVLLLKMVSGPSPSAKQ